MYDVCLIYDRLTASVCGSVQFLPLAIALQDCVPDPWVGYRTGQCTMEMRKKKKKNVLFCVFAFCPLRWLSLSLVRELSVCVSLPARSPEP